MKLNAVVEISINLLLSCNMKPKGKASRTSLSIGKKDKNDQFASLMICTKLDRNGITYKLHQNIDQIFSKYLKEGKCTIRIKEPCHDILINQADPLQLRAFLNVIKTCNEGKVLETFTLSTLAPASTKNVTAPKTTMIISTRSDYPIIESFPITLKSLSVNGILLKTIDQRIMKLRNLLVLDLSKNNIRTLPEDWSYLDRLKTLNLSSNRISTIPDGLISSGLSQCLWTVNLSRNLIEILPKNFWSLKSLKILKLGGNLIKRLPNGIISVLRLETLDLSDNRLDLLPYDFQQAKFDLLDLSGNESLKSGVASVQSNATSPTLLECAARSILNFRVPYTIEDVGHLYNYLKENYHICRCGNHCFESHVYYRKPISIRGLAASIVGEQRAFCEEYYCSMKCLSSGHKKSVHL